MTRSTIRPNMVITVLCGTLTSMVVIGFARLAYGIILPSMRADLGLTYQQAGILGTITALCYVCFVLSGGLAAARWGARASVLFGMSIVVLGFAGLTLASSFWLIALLMGLLGFGTAFAFAPMVTLLATWFPEKRGLVIGYMSSGVGIGTLSAGLLVPALLDLFGDQGWRASWGLFGAVALSATLLIALFVRNPPQAASGVSGKLSAAEKWRVYRNPRVLIVASTYGIIGLGYIVQTIFMVSFMVESGHGEVVAGRLRAMSWRSPPPWWWAPWPCRCSPRRCRCSSSTS